MKLRSLNYFLLLSPLFIFLLGIFTLFSLDNNVAKNQLVYFIIGSFIYAFASLIDYHFFKQSWKWFYYIVLALLLYVYFSYDVRFGAVRWINLGFFSIQPSEFAKVALIFCIGSLIASKKDFLQQTKSLVSLFGYFLPLFLLVFLQPDLGTSLVLLCILFCTLYYAGLRKEFFLVCFVLFGLLSEPFWHSLHDYQQKRIIIFFNPYVAPDKDGYNVIQSIIAVGSGQTYGRGYGRGTQSHLNFLPAYWTDFIFASFAEEWGFIGVLILYCLFFILFGALLYLAYICSDIFGSLISFSTFAMLFFQFTVNVGMNMGIMPVTGIPLPLFSYGGSSLIINCFILGVCQSVCLRLPAYQNTYNDR